MKPSLTYILGSGHSGSTILQFLLAGHPGVIGLGEVFQPAMGPVDESMICSCGSDYASCPVWAGTAPAVPGNSSAWYRELAKRLTLICPEATHWVDSSKLPAAISPWMDLLQENIISRIRVLYLVRDVRGWVLSDQRARQRKAKSPRGIFRCMKVWRREQNKMLAFLKESSLDYQIVSYESLIFNTESMLKKIGMFLGLDQHDLPWEDRLKSAVVHDVFGNRVKNNPKARGRLTYDDSWQYSLPVNLLACALLPVWSLNRELRIKGGL